MSHSVLVTKTYCRAGMLKSWFQLWQFLSFPFWTENDQFLALSSVLVAKDLAAITKQFVNPTTSVETSGIIINFFQLFDLLVQVPFVLLFSFVSKTKHFLNILQVYIPSQFSALFARSLLGYFCSMNNAAKRIKFWCFIPYWMFRNSYSSEISNYPTTFAVTLSYLLLMETISS